MRWRPVGKGGGEEAALARPLIEARVTPDPDGRWFASVNGYLMNTTCYETRLEAKAALVRYLRRKLKQAMAEMEEER